MNYTDQAKGGAMTKPNSDLWFALVLIWLAALAGFAVVLAVVGLSWSTGLVTFAGLAVVVTVAVFGPALAAKRL